MKIAVITSGGRIARWQADALRAFGSDAKFTIYDCVNSRNRRQMIRHGLYYALNLLAVRNRQTAAVALPADLPIDEIIPFEAVADKSWERLPATIIDRISAGDPAVIVKFGMGLLRVPDGGALPCPILSFHHGDPRAFRGRPAGFYELLQGRRTVGQVVQILSDQLDSGKVVAFAETKAHAHSWKQTLVEAFRVSPLLLPQAIANVASRTTLAIAPTGRNYRLPNNLTVIRFAFQRTAAWLRWIAYGALWEKGWTVAEVQLRDGWNPDNLDQAIAETDVVPVPVRAPHIFYADPFFDPERKLILAEAMRPDGRGEIVSLSPAGAKVLPIPGGHLSYPATFLFDGRSYLLPEMESWSGPLVYELKGDGAELIGPLRLPGNERLLDATLHEQGDQWYLFANRSDDPLGVLRLWAAASPFEPFVEHPSSPILFSPRGGRMGGSILSRNGELYRPGQDLRGAYGDGLLLFRIEELSPARYQETDSGSLRFTRWRGPHTLNVRGNKALVDLYEDRFSPLAGLRRLRQSRG